MRWQDQLQRLVEATAGALSLSNQHLVLAHKAPLPASSDALYRARGRGETRNDHTVPAMNLWAVSRLAREVYAMATAVQRGASTLPETFEAYLRSSGMVEAVRDLAD